MVNTGWLDQLDDSYAHSPTSQEVRQVGGGFIKMAGKQLVVYGINEHKGKSFFTRVGAAFQNRDGSLNLILNYLPVNGKLQVREAPEKEEDPQMPLGG